MTNSIKTTAARHLIEALRSMEHSLQERVERDPASRASFAGLMLEHETEKAVDEVVQTAIDAVATRYGVTTDV